MISDVIIAVVVLMYLSLLQILLHILYLIHACYYYCMQVACGSSATTKRFFVAVYQDKYLAKPIQIWQFYVHALQRVDVACIEGQTSRFTLILR